MTDTDPNEIPLRDQDYYLPEDQPSVWIRVDGCSVHVHRADEAVIVDLYRNGHEMDRALAGTYVFKSDLDTPHEFVEYTDPRKEEA